MTIRRNAAALPFHFVFFIVVFVFGGLAATDAWSQAQVVQTLDQVKVFGGEDVVRMPFNDPYRADQLPPPPADDASLPTGISWPAGFVGCKQTSAAGLICLTKDEWVVNWPDLSDTSGDPKLFSCNAIDKLLDQRAPNTCTGLTADESGAIWLAGKNKGKTHSLVKITAGACSSEDPDRQTIGGAFCAETWDTGRPLLLDVTRVEGQLAARIGPVSDGTTTITGGDLVVGLEQRLDAVLFSAEDAGKLVSIPGGKNGWNLDRKELLQSIAVLQRKIGDSTFESYVLVSTSNGRILAKNLGNLGAAADEVGADADCAGSTDPLFSLRASPKGEVVYLSNRGCSRVVALQAAGGPGDLSLVPAQETKYADADGNAITDPEPTDVPPLYTGSLGPEGLTVAPGEDFNLEDCAGDDKASACRLVQGASLWNVSFQGQPGVTLFQIKNIPDCRWKNSAAECVEHPEAIVDDDETGEPSAQYLNVKPLLPPEVIDALDSKGVILPEQMLISPQFRAQGSTDPNKDRRFEAFFVAVDPGTTFTGTFDGEFDALILAGAELGCKNPDGTYTEGTDWDIVTKISEKFSNAPDPDGGFDRYEDVLLNTGCGSSAIKSMGFSLFSYNLEVTPDTYLPGRTVDGDDDGNPEVVQGNDAVFARLVAKLFRDLDYVARHYACNTVPGDTVRYPISATKCSTLLASLANAGDKLGKCIEATYQPKQSASNQNCQSFLQQIDSFRAALAAPDPGPVGSDPANRVGELDVRYSVLMHVYDTRFVPSIPSGGFCEESATCQ